MTRSIRGLLLFEAVTFIAAALVHSGVLVHGYEHDRARVAETVIGLVLLLGFAATFARGAWARRAALGAQAFALLGTLVGLFTVAVGVGPRTVADVVYHFGILAVLTYGLLLFRRAPAGAARARG